MGYLFICSSYDGIEALMALIWPTDCQELGIECDSLFMHGGIRNLVEGAEFRIPRDLEDHKEAFLAEFTEKGLRERFTEEELKYRLNELSIATALKAALAAGVRVWVAQHSWFIMGRPKLLPGLRFTTRKPIVHELLAKADKIIGRL